MTVEFWMLRGRIKSSGRLLRFETTSSGARDAYLAVDGYVFVTPESNLI